MAKKKHRGHDHSSVEAHADGALQAGPESGAQEYEALIERLRAGKMVLCTGAALGTPVGRPTWRALVDDLLRNLERDDPSRGPEIAEARAMLDRHPLTTGAYVRRQLGDEFSQALDRVLPKNGALPEAVQILGKLPFRAALTTAFDDLLERAFAATGQALRTYTAGEVEEMRREGRGRYILHVFGDPSRGKDVVLGAGDLLRLLSDDAFRHLARELFHKRSFLFLGFDQDDPDFEILLDRVIASTGPRAADSEGPQHFAVLPGLGPVARAELEAAFGIRVLSAQDGLEVARLLRDAVGEHAMDFQPDDDDLEGWLRVLQQEPGRTDAVARLDALARRLREAGETDRLIELWFGRAEVETEPARRAAGLRHIADLLENDKGQMAEAFHTMLEAYKEDPGPDLLDELERLAGTTGQWVELLTALRELIGNLPAAQRPDVWVRIARLYGDKLNHLDYALASLAEAQKLEIQAPGTRRELRELRVDLCRRAERWKDLADAIGVLAAEVPERERKIDLYLEQGDVYESRLSDGVSAAGAFRKALEVDPQSRDAMAALEHLLRRHRNWADLVDLLDRKVSLLEGAGENAPALTARREAAAIATEHLADRKASITRWEAVRARDEEDLDALRALEKLYAQEGSFSEQYLEILNALARVVTSDKERLALYRRLAAEYEELPGHLPQAAAALERIVDIDAHAEDAYRGLVRIYRQDRKWILLIDTYRRHAKVAQGGKAELYAAIGRTYEIDLPEGNQDQALLAAPQAIEAYSQVLQSDPEHRGAMEALCRLYQQTEMFGDALRYFDKRANLAEDKAEKVALLSEGARLCETRLRDFRAAEERYVRALEADPHHVPTMLALSDIYRKQGEPLRAARLLIEAEGHTVNRLDKVRCLVGAAEMYRQVDESGQAKAADLYLQALGLDPEHVEAGARAVELLWQRERYAEMIPILEMLTRKEGDREEQVRWLGRLGQAALKVGDKDKALKAYTRAAEVDPADLLSQRGRAELLFAARHWVEAKEAAVAVLSHHRDSLSAGEMVEMFYLVGECERNLERRAEARNFFAKALEIDPAHRPTLKGLLQLQDTSAAEGVETRRALLGSAGSVEERIKLLTEIGDLLGGSIKDVDGAMAAYREALSLKPDAHVVLHKALDLVIEARRWPDALEVLEALIKHESNAKRRARYRQTAALLCRDELKDSPRAIAFYAAALEDDPQLERAAADLEKLVLEQGDFRELARIYKRKIKMLGPDSEASTKEQRAERLRLWSGLAQVCAEKLGDLETAIAATEVTVALDRGNIERHRVLARLYVEAGPDRADKAIAEHQTLLRMNKGELGSYRALRRLYGQVKQREKAACVAYALHILKKGDPEDEKLVAELRARPLQPARRPMKPELWRTLAHPEEDLQLGALFQAVFPVVQPAYARPFKDVGLNRKDRLEPTAQQLYAKALRYGVEVLEGIAPEAYVQPAEKERPYTIVHCMEKGQQPVICVQLGAQLTNPKRPEREVMYEIGRLCAVLRPKRVLRTLLPSAAQLGLIIDAVMSLSMPEGGVPAKVAETAVGLKRALQPAVLEQVTVYGKALRDAGVKGEAAATAWLGWSDLTAVRAGLVLSGDLETVALLLATDPPGSSPLPPKQRLLETLHFSVTEEYFTIRQHLGLMG
jgi:tetratricopeptide (TPR) repeat protein